MHNEALADELRMAGLVVVKGRSGIGRTASVSDIEVRPTGTGKDASPAADVNKVVSPARAVAFVERTGRVWLLANGPQGTDATAVVFLAQYRAGDEVPEVQADALAALLAVLGGLYGLEAPDIPAVAASDDAGDDEDDSE
jgi:hypothetical protein